MNKLEELEKENQILKKKLRTAQHWMEREVKVQLKYLTQNQIHSELETSKNQFFTENVEELITRSIKEFFWELMILNTPQAVIENIISAEILFYNMRKTNHTDGLWVISSYHKSIDMLIESTISKPFRKFAKKKWQIYLRKNDPLEKSMHLVVNKWYILWIWKLYNLLEKIHSWNNMYDYSICFREFLEKNNYIFDILSETWFYQNLKALVISDLIWKKRHIWKINFEETKKARNLLIGDLKEKNSIIYKLIEMWKIDF